MYRKNTYKYGSKSLNDIANIPTSQLRVGDSVFNTTWKIPEFWTGNTWTNEHCTVGFSSNSITPGLACHWVDSTVIPGTAWLELATNTTRWKFAGICVRSVASGPLNVITFAIKGRWPVRFTETVTRGEYVTLNGTGTCTASGTSSAGTVGVVLESATYSGTPITAMCYINGIEKY